LGVRVEVSVKVNKLAESTFPVFLVVTVPFYGVTTGIPKLNLGLRVLLSITLTLAEPLILPEVTAEV
jgi:hypothetical protein